MSQPGFLQELKRRKVVRVGIVYAATAFVVVQAADIMLPRLGVPDWGVSLVVALSVLGFPIALVLAWALEVTPDGIQRTRPAPADAALPALLGRRTVFTAALLVAAGVGLSAGWLLKPSAAATGGRADAGSVATASIAVLPFVNMSADVENDYFADGISEEILNLLARIEGLRVVGRTSSFKFKGQNDDLRVIGEQLGVTHILEGSVRRANNQIRVTAQLVLVDNGFHLWSDTWDRELTDIFAVQDEIGQAVADALSIRLGGTALPTRRGTASTRAHELALKARELLSARGAPNLVQAADTFLAAVRLDPDYSEAWSGRARALSLIWNYDQSADGKGYATLAEDAAQRALALDPDNVEALSVLAYLDDIVHWEWERSQRRLLRAIALAPNDAEIANFAGDHFTNRMDVENMLTWERKAIELDPLKAVNHSDLGWRLLALRRCDEALVHAERALAVDPNFLMGWDLKANVLICLERYEDARTASQVLRAAGEHASAHITDVWGRAMAADRPQELRASLQLIREQVEAGRVSYYLAAVIADLAGEPETAAAWLNRSFEAGEAWVLGDPWRLLPEDWSDHPAVRAALNRPRLTELFDIRRRNLAAWHEQQGTGR